MGTDPQIGSFHELRWLVTALKARAPTVLYEEAVDKMDPIHRRYRTDDDDPTYESGNARATTEPAGTSTTDAQRDATQAQADLQGEPAQAAPQVAHFVDDRHALYGGWIFG